MTDQDLERIYSEANAVSRRDALRAVFNAGVKSVVVPRPAVMAPEPKAKAKRRVVKKKR